MVGTSISHYKILEKIGEGGMGEVYRATDTKLNRDVALKILPEQFASDSQRMGRFQREAEVLASLDHPNIGQIYGIEEAGATKALVLQLIEGPTLAEKIAQGAIPLEETLKIALQIAEGLEAAHEKGVIHRDLKPANIKVTPEGQVKILDFGLAKALEGETPDSSLSQSPTLTNAATQAGVILGTAAYMSPEQARGQPVDKRADIFAFGAVLYECLTGKRAFEGEDISDTLASILAREPNWEALSIATPQRIRDLLQRCFEKDSKDRLPHIAEARFQVGKTLKEPTTELPMGIAGAAQPPLWRRAIPWVITLVAVVVAGIAGWWVTQLGVVTPVTLQRFSIDLPEETVFPPGVGTNFDISPDGQSLVYVGVDAGGQRLYLRHLDELEATPIPGTEDAIMPFFSPDGQWVAFGDLSGTRLKRVPLSGGEPFTLCTQCVEGFWGDDGSIVFDDKNGSLWRIPEVGSSPELLAKPMPNRGVPGMTRPVLLPGAEAVLFEIAARGTFASGGVGVLSLENNEFVVVSNEGANPLYSSSGHILFARENTLFAVPFDVERFEVTGPAVPVLQGVRVENGRALQADVSRDGLLVYQPAGTEMGTQLVWVNREGILESVLDEQWRVFVSPRISPDGKKVAVQINDGGDTDIWIHDSGTFRLLTTDGESAFPVWTPDGSGVAFSSGSAGSFAIQWTKTDGNSEVETLLSSENPVLPVAWSPEENQLVFQEGLPNPNLFIADVRDGGSRTAFLETNFSEHSAALSHSGKWLAYVSNRSGADEVYVRPFPGPGAEQVISRGGGNQPVWDPDDTELFYRDLGGSFLMVASLQTEPFQVLSREGVFAAGDFWGGQGHAHYDIHSNGERFLMINMQDSDVVRPKIHVVLNWFEELRRLTPTN